MKQNLSSVTIFPEQGGLLKRLSEYYHQGLGFLDDPLLHI